MNKLTEKLAQGRFNIKENVEYKLFDKDGNEKQMFVVNKLGELFLKAFRYFISKPLTKDGQVKPGLLNKLAVFGIRIPYLTGNWQYGMSISNLVTNAGLAGMASRCNGSGGEAAFTYIGLGSGTTAAAAGDTALETEYSTGGLSRASATVSRVTTDVSNDTAQLVNTFSATASNTVTESGVFNAAASGTLLARQVFSGVALANGDNFQVTWKLDFD